MQRLLRSSLWVMTLAWPLVAWLSITHARWRWLLAVMGGLFLLRWLMSGRPKNAALAPGKYLAACGALLCLASFWLHENHLLLWYPVAVNIVMLLVFGGSLLSGMPLVERLARLREPNLPHVAVVYTRRVTQVWCLFFLVNGSVALATCLAGNMALWTGWNGMASYLLMGLLMGGEWLVRQRLRRRQ
ncbi:hypothetical protein PMPD1_1762 [Paramixta manurensis]|uniref:DNA gyrase subunit B n=1 Tax=Paramixta manurensis TaxID=2740817 RepID=A0A6M8UIR1_9GAMM|nr:hypothetical protein PMPD1_1762 [Erwiniaceae bacterium PD-1]